MKKKKSVFRNPQLEEIFNLEALPEVALEIPLDHWNDILHNYDLAPDVNFFTSGDFVFSGHGHIPDQRLPNVGLRVRGNSSRNRPEGNDGEPHNPENPLWRQTSFALQFGRYESGQKFEGLSRIDLKFIREDPSRIREVYSFDLYQQAGIYSGPLMSMCRFYIQVVGGGPRAYFGVYKLKEYIEDDYLDDRKEFFGDDQPGPYTPFLWKGDNGAAFNNYDPSAIENRDVYDLRINTSQRAVANAQLTDFVRNLVTLEGEELKNWANNAMDVKLFLKTYIINVICGNVDDYWFNANNFNFYFNTHGKFFYIPNDFDTTLGTAWGIDVGTQDIDDWGNPSHLLVPKLLTVLDFAIMYLEAFRELTNAENGPFYVTRSIERIEKWYALINDHIWDDTVHFGCSYYDGCVLQTPQTSNYQTPFEDTPAWWTSGGNNADYRLLERGENNYFEVRTEYPWISPYKKRK